MAVACRVLQALTTNTCMHVLPRGFMIGAGCTANAQLSVQEILACKLLPQSYEMLWL